MVSFYLLFLFFFIDNLTVHLNILSVIRCSWLASARRDLSSVVIGLLLAGAHLLMVLVVSDDFTQHVNEAAISVRDFPHPVCNIN